MIRKYIKGGLNMFDLRSHITTMLVNWVKKLINDKCNSMWSIIPKFYYNMLGENLSIFKGNIDNIKNIKNIEQIPTFYQNILKSWIEIGGGEKKISKNNN